jgi:Txe/YoeB family toxin of Txe-Axe toxin-antitoxin module
MNLIAEMKNSKPKRLSLESNVSTTVLNSLKTSINVLNPKQKREMEDASIKLIKYFDKLDIRIETYQIISKFEDVILSGIIQGNSQIDERLFGHLESYLKVLQEIKIMLENSVNNSESVNFLDINYISLNNITSIFSFALDVPELGNNFIQYLFNINQGEITEMSTLYSKLLILTEISIIYNNYIKLNKLNGIGSKNNIPQTKIKSSELLLNLNKNSIVLNRYFNKEFNFIEFRKKLNFHFSELFNGLISNNRLVENLKNASSKGDIKESNSELTPSLDQNILINASYYSQTYKESMKKSVNEIQKTDLFEETILSIKQLGFDIELHNKASQQKNKLKNNFNWNSVLEIFKLIKESEGSLETFVSRNMKNKGLNAEFLKGKFGNIMSVRLNQKHRLSLTQDTLGKITILSFGGHYDFLKARN